MEAGTASSATTAPTGGLTDSSGPLTSASSFTSPAIAAVSTSAPSTPLTSASTSTASMSTATVSSTGISTSVTSSPAMSTSVAGSTSVISSIGSAEMIVKLFETQSQLLAAQMQAATLLPLVSFDGQCDSNEMEFERWLERFKERARLAKWTEETKLCQLKLHLSKVVDQTFQMLSKDVKSSYERVAEALKKWFQSVEIEELKSMEFHRCVQGDETIQELGMDLQKLVKHFRRWRAKN